MTDTCAIMLHTARRYACVFDKTFLLTALPTHVVGFAVSVAVSVSVAACLLLQHVAVESWYTGCVMYVLQL